MAHVVKMEAKRLRRAVMQPGFTPVRNAAIDGRIGVLTTLLTHEGGDADVARTAAITQVRQSLPPERRVARWWLHGPTKSDNPQYRKN
jgi:hypothetical protein